MNKFLIILICLFLTAFAVNAKTIHVPKQFKTIQEGINEAVDGDVVLVAHGTYYENINFMGKEITVASHFYLDHKKQHIKKTIINGSKPADPDFGSVVYFVSGEDTNSVLCGFTITGGTGTVSIMPNNPPMRQGGGIYCSFSGAKIIYNNVIKNNIENTAWPMGGGFFNGPPFAITTAVLEHNIFENNTVTGQLMATGGGIAFNSAGRIANNIVQNNIAYSFGVNSNGGGVALSSWPPDAVHWVDVYGNRIVHNKALQAETGPPGISSHAGGLTIIGSKGVIRNNVFMFNEISPVDSGFGAGVVLDYPPEDLLFKNNVVAHNYYTGSGRCYGGGVAIWDGSPTLENNLIIDNKGTHGGGVWAGLHFCNSKFINNTIANNTADVQGGAIDTYNSHPTLMNSILWGNKAPMDAELCLESGEIDVSYCDIAGGWDGEGNIDSRPLMMGKTYLLTPASPCVDGGSGDEIYNDPENPRHPGYAARPARGTIRNDMGAFGGPNTADWKMDFKSFNPSPIVSHKHKAKMHCFPNPFNSQTTVEFDLDETEIVSLQIYNALGQVVATLVNGKLEPGHKLFTWNANKLASGLYFIQFKTSSFEQIEKLMLVK